MTIPLGKTNDGRRLSVLWRPSENERIRIVGALLLLQRQPNPPFQAVWCINGRLKVRRTHLEELWILAWCDARELIDKPAPKPAVKESQVVKLRKRA